MPAPTIGALPTPPSRNQSPDVFTTNADAFLGALPPFRTQINDLVSYLNSTAMVLGQFGDGTAALPSIRFESDPDTGFYLIGANQLGATEGGVATGRLYGRNNIVGTVSQSGGVPTGAVVERGSNANGEYVRFACGTQICWVVGESQSADSASGSVFITSTTATWTFPAAFVDSTIGLSGAVAGSTTRWVLASLTSSTAVTYRQASTTSSAGALSSRLMAVGRWF